MTNPIVTIEMENGDIMKAELYPEVAPNTVNMPGRNRNGRPGIHN